MQQIVKVMQWLYRQHKKFMATSTRDMVVWWYTYVGLPVFVLMLLGALIKVL